MWKLLAKWLSPAVLGAGLICATMHLTNASNGLFNSLQLLDINNKPDVPEEELEPKQEQKEEEEEQADSQTEDSDSQNSQDSQDDGQQSQSETGQQSSNSSDTQTQSPSTTSSNGKTDVKEVIKILASTIHTRSNSWINSSGSLPNIHEALSSLSRFAEAVQQFSSQAGTGSEGTQQ